MVIKKGHIGQMDNGYGLDWHIIWLPWQLSHDLRRTGTWTTLREMSTTTC